jgi:hypothetical protein
VHAHILNLIVKDGTLIVENYVPSIQECCLLDFYTNDV